MKITKVTPFVIKDWRSFLFVAVETDQGISGIGEAGISGRELAVAGMVEHLSPLLIGEDPFRTEHLWQTMWRGGFHPAGQILSSAIAAIDIALWDIKGKALGVPVYQLLGGRVRDRILTYTHIRGVDTDAVRAAAAKAVDEGWQCLRWEPFAEPDGTFHAERAVDRALREFELLRQDFGPDVELCFDAHTKLRMAEAVRLCRGAEPYRPMFIEDPLRSENPDSYRRLREQVTVPIAAGEQYASKWDFREMVERELIDFARIDICIAGGLTESMKIAGWCETRNIDIAVHNPLGPVSTAACLHFNMACSNMLVQELPRRPGEVLPNLVTGQSEWRDGWLLPPEAPGLGVEFHADRAGDYSSDSEPLPMLRRPDGAFTNW